VQSGDRGTSVVRVLVRERELHRRRPTWIVLAAWAWRCSCSACSSPTGSDGAWSARSRIWAPPPIDSPPVTSPRERAATGRGSCARLRRAEPAGSPDQRTARRERAEVADLAHRLRTPLTALRLTPTGCATGRERATHAGRPGADPAGRRADPHRAPALARRIRRARRSGRVAAQRLAFWTALAEDTGRRLSGKLPEHPVTVRASEADLAAALDVLLDNAFTHTRRAPPSSWRSRRTDACGWTTPARVRQRCSASRSTGLGLDHPRRTARPPGRADHRAIADRRRPGPMTFGLT